MSSIWIDAFRAMARTMENAFRKPTTVEFPKVIRPRAERFRASFALPDDEHGELACVACLACEKVCPSQVIKMKSGGKRESPVTGKKRAYVDEFSLDLSACIQCELCVQVCNNDAIVMVREPEQPAYAREELVLDMARLRANAKGKTASWGRGTMLQEMQESKPKGDKAEKTEKTDKAEKTEKPKPAATKPAEAKTADAKTDGAESKPADAKAAEPKPDGAEAKPAEAKPADAKPADAKPAVTAVGGTP